MNLNHDRNHTMEGQDILSWRSQPTSTPNMSATGDEEIIPADVDEPPELLRKEFTKAAIRPQNDRAESLITRGLKSPPRETQRPDIHITTDLMRRRSLMSTGSLASTAELTSDGGFTSPARTSTPSPPFPNSYYSMSRKSAYPPPTPVAPHEAADPIIAVHTEILYVSPRAAPVVPLETAPKKRCISFACGPRKDPAPRAPVVAVAKPLEPSAPIVEAPKRKCTIKFACPTKPTEKYEQRPLEKPFELEPTEISKRALQSTSPARKRVSSRSPSTTRKPRPTPTSSIRPHRESTGTIRRASQSPVAVRCKPKYVIAGEKDLQSEAARFHEFCSEGVEEDDWIRKDEEVPKARITINDTLAKEIKFRKLGSEVEEEALEEDDEDDFDDGNDSDNEDGSDEDQDEDDETDREYSEEDDTDGNETDNEAGFADSDEEDDTEGDFAFWTPHRLGNATIPIPNNEVSSYRTSANRHASASSIESSNDGMAPLRERSRGKRKSKKTRSIKIRPGTPDLPDSTDFVCGTLDEDRPLEDAYVSCMEARKYAKHIPIPQDIDPSFPTSDPEDESSEDDFAKTLESDEQVWMQGKFEDSGSDRRRARGHSPRKLHSPPPPKRLRSPPPPKKRLQSPPPPKKRLQSPPPPKKRLQSPPPRNLFGNDSPTRPHSPLPARAVYSPPASPSINGSKPIQFAPLGSRPGLTHTKSLPRTPNAFCRQYTASRIAAANEIAAKDDGDGPLRGAIDIVKGLEQKRQRRKEKFYQKHCANRARKPQPERRPQPGKGAERMRELGLLMAGKPATNDPYILSA
ncbi:hypothetical protein NHQ30_005195 [Ciborinia camelliae]|nr:hypothetical protein NHQ30_005195 [Ciborinia camelliae]